MTFERSDAEMNYRLSKLFVISLYNSGIISEDEAVDLREHLIDKFDPPIGILEEGQTWRFIIRKITVDCNRQPTFLF